MNDGYSYDGSSDSGPIPSSHKNTSIGHSVKNQGSGKAGTAIVLIIAAIFIVPFIATAAVFIAYIPTVNRMIDESVQYGQIDTEAAKRLGANQQRIMARLFTAYHDDEVNAIGLSQSDCSQIDEVAKKTNDSISSFFSHDICSDGEIKYYVSESGEVVYLEFLDGEASLEIQVVENMSKVLSVTRKTEAPHLDKMKTIKITSDVVVPRT